MAKAKQDALKEVDKNVEESAMSGGSSVQDTSEHPLQQIDEYVAESAMPGDLDRTVNQRTIADTPQPPRGSAEEVSGEVSSLERQRMIEEAAYYWWQRRQQEGREGSPDGDWAEGEAQIDREQRNRRRD